MVNRSQFRRTKFGNGLFAVLILCLTIADLAATFFSVLGSLIVEYSHFVWGGAPGSCKVSWNAFLLSSSLFLHLIVILVPPNLSALKVRARLSSVSPSSSNRENKKRDVFNRPQS
jgi:hypothetical protein